MTEKSVFARHIRTLRFNRANKKKPCPIHWERCRDQIVSTQIECVCCREQLEEESKTVQGIILLSLYYIGCSKWKNNFRCNLVALGIYKRHQF